MVRIVLAFAFSILAAGCHTYSPDLAPKISSEYSPKLTFFDVGQGDFIFLSASNHCLFIDAGGNQPLSAKILVQIRQGCADRKNILVLTHFDFDHFSQALTLVRYLRFSEAFVPSLDTDKPRGQHLLRSLKQNGVAIRLARAGDRLIEETKPKVTVDVLWPPIGFAGRSSNDISIAILIKSSEISILTAGDLPGRLEKRLSIRHADVLKVSHHGSGSSTSKDWLLALNPRTCVLSVGRHNIYHHPNPTVLKNLKTAHCAILSTANQKTIEFEL